MKHINFSGEINTENTSILLSAIDEIDDKENIIIYFESQGGDCSSADIIVDFLDRNHKRITIKPVWIIGSCAFDICYRTKAKVKLLGDVWGQVHITSKKYEFRDTLDRDEFDYHYSKWQKKYFKQDIKQLDKLLINGKEKESIKQGKIVVIDPTRMRKIFK